MSNDGATLSPVVVVLVVLVGILGLIALDIAADYRAGTSATHVGVEVLVMALCGVGMTALWREYRAQRTLATGLQRDISVVQAEADRWREDARRLLDDLASAVDRQFGEWRLTEAERDVAFALLRGLSHKEVARERETSERTVREQARAVYQKAGLDGRSALAAFFLRDLDPPAGDASPGAHA